MLLAILRGTSYGQTSPCDTFDPGIVAGAHQSRLCVGLVLKAGNLTIDSAASRLYPSPSIDRGKSLSDARKVALQADLLTQLSAVFAQLPKLSHYGFTDAERAAETAKTLVAGTGQPLDTASEAVWDKLVDLYTKWAELVPERRDVSDAVNALVTDLQNTGGLDLNTGLFKQPGALDNLDLGILILNVADLAPGLADKSALTVCFVGPAGDCGPSGQVLDRKSIQDILSGTSGNPWIASAIQQKLEAFYTRRGLQPGVLISVAGAPNFILVAESQWVTRVMWKDPEDQAKVAQILGILLKRADFSNYLAHPSELPQAINLGGGPGHFLRYRGTCPPPDPPAQPSPCKTLDSPSQLLNGLLLTGMQAQLDELGFAVNVQKEPPPAAPGAGDPLLQNRLRVLQNVALLVQSKSPEGLATRPESVPDPAASKLPEQGAVLPPKTPDPKITTTPKTLVAAENKKEPLTVKEKKNFLGAGLTYNPGQRIKFFGLGQRSRTDIGSAVGELTGQLGANGEALGSGTANLNYLLFDTLHRRLMAQFTGNTDFTQKRILNGQLTDQRSTGGLAHFEFDLLGGNESSLLTLNGDFRRSTIELTAAAGASPEAILSKTNLTTAQLGATFLLRELNRRRPFALAIDPGLLLGLGASATEKPFQLLTTQTNFNLHLFDRVLTTLDVTGRAQWASSNTPVFNMPSLGGSETLRGFRADDAMGRKLLSVQPELWFEVPGFAGGASKLADFVNKNLRLAAFMDAGAVYSPLPYSSEGWRAGPGAGLRFIQGFVALKVDWAYGIGNGVSGRGHGRFFVGVSTNSTF